MIAPLRKIYLAGPAGRFNSVFAFLQKKGVMELAETPLEITSPAADKDSVSFYDIAGRVEDLKELIQFLAEGGEASAKGQKKIPGFNAEKILARFPGLKKAFAENRGRINELSDKISRIEKALSLPVDFTSLSVLSMTSWRLFSFPAKKASNLEDFFSGFSDSVLECVYSDSKKKIYMLLFPSGKMPSDENLQSASLISRIEFMDIPADPESELKKLREDLIIAKDEEEMLYDEKKGMAAYMGQLLLVYDYYENVKIREASKLEKVFETGKMFVLSGWIREKITGDVLNETALNFPDLYCESRKPLKGEDVPVSLENNDLAQPYEFLTSMYGVPSYGSVDPSPHAAVFFAFFFGLCLTDAMYGLVIAGVSAWALGWKKTPRELKKILRIFLGGGLFTVAAGAVTGGWCGPDFLSRLPGSLGFLKIAADKLVLFDPVKDALLFVGIAIACGFAQVMWGMVLKCVDDFRQGRTWALFFEDIAAIMIQISMPALLAVYALKIFTPGAMLLNTLHIMFGAGAASIVTYNLITQEGPIFKLLWSYYGLYSVLTGNAFSDILSYIRLFALGLTTGLVAMAINEIVWIVVSWGVWAIPFAAVFFVLLHAGNLVINMLGATVHTMRLQFYEFFTKFIRTGGHYFKPLKNFVKYSSLESAETGR
ncbi:MAG: hypothetical protein CVU78_02320 [Elusimicrobia bacterium HGW-Elusimicrobia-2]|nr:MAG: hypothetical protein CVU78_02320 [Elusimicrobia bacterium HGW-Elusimicrobia-2]